MPPIRYALLQDFDALNRVETVGFDAWHELIDKPEPEVTGDELALLDEIAGTTANVDSRFSDLRALYRDSAYGQAVRRRLARGGVASGPGRPPMGRPALHVNDCNSRHE